MRLLLTTLLIAIGLLGCSKEDLSKSPYLGERLMSLVDTIDSPPPAPNALNLLIKECNFKEGSASRHASNCHFTNIVPKRQRAIEANITIDAITPNCCTTAVYISQGQLDQQGGLDLFATLSGVKKKELKCPKIQANNNPMFGSDFFEIQKDGKTKFFIRQDYNGGGSGGQSIDTTVFFGKPKAMYAADKIVEGCDYFEHMQDDFYAARRGEGPNTKQAAISSCADGKTAAEIIACLARSPERVNKYESLNFYTITHPDEERYLSEYLSIGDDCDKLLKTTIRRSSQIMLIWIKYGNNGYSTVTPYVTQECGTGSNTDGGRFPKTQCNKVRTQPLKDTPSKIYFDDDSLNKGLIVSKYGQSCNVFEGLKKIQGIHYQSTSVTQDGCNDKTSMVEYVASENSKSHTVRNVLVCSK